MKSFSIQFVILLFVASLSLYSQDSNRHSESRSERYTSDYFSLRLGFWYPKDTDLEYQGKTYSNLEAEIDRSQAYGFDLHYRHTVGGLLFTDFSLGAWYSSYDLKNKGSLTNIPVDISSWTLVLPITVGLSISPLMEEPIHPYVMGGVGAYVGITGMKSRVQGFNDLEKSRTKVTFGGFLGIGFDFMISRTFGLSAAVKYQFVNFKEGDLFTEQKNLAGVMVQFGATMKR